MLEAMPPRLTFPQGVSQGSKTVDWIRKPRASKSPAMEDRLQEESSPSGQAAVAEAERQQYPKERAQHEEEDIHAADQRREHWER